MKRILHNFSFKKLILIINIIIVFAGGLYVFFNPQVLVTAKYHLFSTYIENDQLFKSSPSLLEKDNFLTDPADLIFEYENKIKKNIGYIRNYNVDTTLSIIKKVKSIILLFSKNGGGGCLPDDRLIETLRLVHSENGHGCCSDHSEAFIALSTIFNIFSREVHNIGHVFNEFYDYNLKKWVWIDPQFAILAKDSLGIYLSLSELRQYYLHNKKVQYEFFGNDYHYFNKHNPYKHEYYDHRDDFKNIMLTYGNNVFSEDQFENNFRLLPKFLRQFLGLSIGKIPKYYVLSSQTTSDRIEKIVVLSILIFYIVNIILLIYFSANIVFSFIKK